MDVCKPGDEVTVVGVVKRRWKPINKFEGGRINIDLVIKVLSGPKALVRVPRGRQILWFDSYRLRDAWRNRGQTFRDCRLFFREKFF